MSGPTQVDKGVSARKPAIVLVVAVAENGVIGHAGKMPWRIRSELQLFRRATLDKPVVMGRKTFAAIGKPLDRRTNIVVTRDASFAAPGIVVAHDVASALMVARGDALRRGAGEIAVIGGAEIYAQTMPIANRLLVTRVQLAPQGDTFFPPIDLATWREVAYSKHPKGPQDEAGYAIVTYERA